MFNKVLLLVLAALLTAGCTDPGQLTTLEFKNDTGRTSIGRNVNVEGATLVSNGCFRWLPNGVTCRMTVKRIAPAGKLTLDFDGVQKVKAF